MKKNKLIALLCLPLFLASCGGESQPTPSTPDTPPTPVEPVVTKYTVTFVGVNLPAQEVEAGKSIAKPADPSKDGHIFAGWYLDANYTQEATFPLVINKDTTIYACFYSYGEAFQKARVNTIGDNVAGYEYDYTLAVTGSYMNLALAGNTTGNAKYNKASDVSFYDEHVNSGALFYDGSKYEIKKGNKLHLVSLDKDDVVKKYTIKEVGDEYKYDSSSFAKAIFEYDDTKLKSIEKTSTPNEYKLKTSFGFSQGVALVGNYVNHPMVEHLIGSLPETSADTGMYVTFAGNKLNSYRYEMKIDVSGIKFDLSYTLTFKNIGAAPTIQPKVFNNTYVSDGDLMAAKAEINGYLNAYKALEHSSYDFTVKTAVDYAKKNAINATVDGWSKRKVSSDEVYYLNDYEVDTDHKNADLYKEKGLGDCHGARVKLSTGEVHDLKKKAVLSGYNDVKMVTHEDVDNFYLFDLFANLATISFIQKRTESGKTIYSIGGDDASAVEVLDYFNDLLRLNPLGECSCEVKAFGTYTNVEMKDFKFSITIEGGKLSEIALFTNGAMKTAFVGSRDFETAAEAGFKLDYKLTITDKGASYEPAASVDKVK